MHQLDTPYKKIRRYGKLTNKWPNITQNIPPPQPVIAEKAGIDLVRPDLLRPKKLLSLQQHPDYIFSSDWLLQLILRIQEIAFTLHLLYSATTEVSSSSP